MEGRTILRAVSAHSPALGIRLFPGGIKRAGTGRFKLHPFRNRATTCASQLRYPREGRDRLGHWAPGGGIPDGYDKAVCASELRIRADILDKVHEEWRPQKSFDAEAKVPQEEAGPTSVGTSVAPADTLIRDRRREGVSDLFVGAPEFSDFS